MTVQQIYNFLDRLAPFASMPEWDNSGLLVGDPSVEVTKVALCLDATPETILQARMSGAQLIISHHPILFEPARRIPHDSPEYLLIRAGIALIAHHIPLDNLPEGPNRMLCGLLGLSPAGQLGVREWNGRILCDGIIGLTGEPVTAEELAQKTASVLGSPARYSDSGKWINRVGVCGGAGGYLIREAVASGCEALITGECKHHELLEAEAAGLTMVVGGHYATEKHIPVLLRDKLREEFGGLDLLVCHQTEPCGNSAG